MQRNARFRGPLHEALSLDPSMKSILTRTFGLDRTKLVKFAIVGVTNNGLDFVLFTFLYVILELHLIASNTLSYLIVVAGSYVAHRNWTFQANTTGFGAFGRFLLINVLGLGLSNLILWSFAQAMPPLAAKLCAVCITAIFSYVAYCRFVYRVE